jgi:hypothetical protein
MSELDDVFTGDLNKLGSGQPPRTTKRNLRNRRRELELQRKLKELASIKPSWASNPSKGYGKIVMGDKFESNRLKF